MKTNTKEYRKNKGWTQEEFAKKLKMSISYVKKVELGLIFPSGKSLARISLLLECTPADLIKDKEEIVHS